MTAEPSSSRKNTMRVPMPPSALGERPDGELRRLGEELKVQAEDVL
jgi:hypothetical protein